MRERFNNFKGKIKKIRKIFKHSKIGKIVENLQTFKNRQNLGKSSNNSKVTIREN